MLFFVQLLILARVTLTVLVLFVVSLVAALMLGGCSGGAISVGSSERPNSVSEPATAISDVARQTPTGVSPIPSPIVARTDFENLPKPAGSDFNLVPSQNQSIPAPVVRDALYTVVADNVPLKEILFSIARDTAAKVNVVGEIDGNISLSMINQSLETLLREVSRQLPVRYEINGDHILIMSDKPYVRTYRVDYLNIQRISESRVDLATQVGSMRTDIEGAQAGQSGSNGSRLFVENKSANRFWDSLVKSVAGIIGESGGKENKHANVFVNPETGILTVRATDDQHQSISELLLELVSSAQRQVLIEATVVEVTLSDHFESGVDWKVLNNSEQGGAFDYAQAFGGFPQAADAVAPTTALLSYNNANSVLGNLSTTLKLLQQFGDVQVLSSPKIIAMNNQPAVLKVVDNRVYFTFEVDRFERENGDQRTVVDSTVHSVPVGLVMSVTPFINSSDEVILNVRPTISRILNFAEDPSPALAGQSQVRNLIPEIQVREMESLLRVQSGDIAIIGGLMQNKVDNRTTDVPGLSRLPLLGNLFSHKKKEINKTELLVFLKPSVMKRKPARESPTKTQGLRLLPVMGNK